MLDPDSEQYKAAKAEAAAKAKAEKEAKKAAEPDFGPPPTEAELRRRLDERRTHLTGVRDELDEELDVKTQAQTLLAAAQVKLQGGKEQFNDKVAGFRSAAGRTTKRLASAGTAADTAGAGMAGQLGERWKPLVALSASAAALVFLLRKLLKG